jgi:DNA-binding NarL/FixJ family response regulator
MNLYIVEDSQHIQHRLLNFVESLPNVHVVGISADIKTALDAVDYAQPAMDAMILDLHLADGNGLDLLKSVKKTHPEIKVVVLTNHSTDANRIHAQRAGADLFLDKSTDFAQIPAVLEGWQPASNVVSSFSQSSLS